MARDYFANRILDLWHDDNVPNSYIDENGIEHQYNNGNSICGCYFAKDLYATVNTVINDRRLVKYVILDDSSYLFDSRRSGSNNNVDVTQFYWEIRHELEEHAIKSNGNAGGLIIICLIIQDFRTLDLRIRNALAFRVYKTWDRSIKKLKLDAKIDKLLLKMYDKCVRVCDYFFRSLGVAVDIMKKYTLFMANIHDLPTVKFETITGTGLFEKQRDILIDSLVNKISLEMKNDQIKAILYNLRDDLKKTQKKIRINTSDFQEIIIRAKGILYLKEDESDENEDSDHLIPNGRTDKQIKMPIIIKLREQKELSFEEISVIVSVPATTIKRWFYKYKENKDKGVSISELVLIELKSRIKPTSLLTCEREQLGLWIEKYVNPQLYLGNLGLNSMVDVVYQLIERELKETGKNVFNEFVRIPVDKLLKKE